MKRYLVVLVIVLVAGAWVAGFAPEYSARHEAEAERDRLQERVDAAEERLRIAELLGQSLALGDLVREQRFGEAQPLSSAFFDAVRAEAQRVGNPAFRDSLEAVLEARDPVTAALSRGEPDSPERVAALQRRLRRSLSYTVPGAAPTSAAPTAAEESGAEGESESESAAGPGVSPASSSPPPPVAPTAGGATPGPEAARPTSEATPAPEATPTPTPTPQARPDPS